MARPILNTQRRRYRLFAVCAVVIVFLLYRTMQNSWAEQMAPREQPYIKTSVSSPQEVQGEIQKPVDQDVPPHAGSKTVAEVEKENSQAYKADVSVKVEDTKEAVTKEDIQTQPDGSSGGKSESTTDSEDVETSIHSKNPPKGDAQVQTEQTALSEKPLVEVEDVPHWKKQPERHPVPEDELIHLPTGKPKHLPRVQFQFPAETKEARTTREQRLATVKKALVKSWDGYRQNAWMHDELSPVSGSYRDPFCGWAATLVDSLDTLWIAGLKEQFDEAAKAVGNIDFTTTPRKDIPVFETTIRYLGGLVAAFDVSGGTNGNYPILLDKAIELAEILMGIFDTPNRMPVLYYRWKPESVSEPHMAGQVGIAELGTLSMEFTRLAQLTGKDKYYDAVDRITNALVELQKTSTIHMPGLFPETLDASGCDLVATSRRERLREDERSSSSVNENTELDEANKQLGDRHGAAMSNFKAGSGSTSSTSDDDRLERSDSKPAKAITKRSPPDYGGMEKSEEPEGCVPQGLLPSSPISQSFHLGGAQDSAYEYFPKQFALLGGLEEKYRKLHVDTVNAVKKHLLYRPMSKDSDEWDILFPAKVSSYLQLGEEQAVFSYKYEITHLTCFVGGMFGLGAKLFEHEEDMEIAKQLTDGCVWAYNHTLSGVMPDGLQVLPCPTVEKCDFNETSWFEHLDPEHHWRDQQAKSWDEAREKALQEAAANAPGVQELTDEQKEAERLKQAAAAGVPQDVSGENKQSDKTMDSTSVQESGERAMTLSKELSAERGSLKKRSGSSDASEVDTLTAAGADTPKVQPIGDRPLPHDEYVQHKSKAEHLAPGWLRINSKHYLLRPEAIESVFYMYRLTGDVSWMEKGWRMFENTIAAVSTDLAASAIRDVTMEQPLQSDEMESFWIAETLKYYYLLFSKPDTINLDEWVFNTEAHPFKRPV